QKSYERVTQKLLLAYLTLYKNSKDGDYTKNSVLVYLTKSLKKFDPEFEKMIKEHAYADAFENFNPYFNKLPSRSNFQEIVKEWQSIQQSHPQLFKGLESEYFIDRWDMTMGGIL